MSSPGEITSLLRRRQSYRGENPLQIRIAVVLDLDSTALLSMVNGDVRREMLLQPIL